MEAISNPLDSLQVVRECMLLPTVTLGSDSTGDNAWEVNTANRRGEGNHILKGQANPRSFKWNNDGTKLFVLSDSKRRSLRI